MPGPRGRRSDRHGVAPRDRPPTARGSTTVQRDPKVERAAQREDAQRDLEVPGGPGGGPADRRQYASVLGRLFPDRDGAGPRTGGSRAAGVGRTLASPADLGGFAECRDEPAHPGDPRRPPTDRRRRFRTLPVALIPAERPPGGAFHDLPVSA